MTYEEIVDKVVEKTGFKKKDVKETFSVYVEELTASLKENEKVPMLGLGMFSVKDVAASTVCTPLTKGEVVEVPAYKKVKFSPSKTLKDKLK